MGLLKYAPHLMIYVNSETILNNDRFFSPYMRKVIHIIEKNHLTITYLILFMILFQDRCIPPCTSQIPASTWLPASYP